MTMKESRTVHDPFLGKDVQVSDRLTDRLRGRYAQGPMLPNGEPEFGWREFPAPSIQHEAADLIDQLVARLSAQADVRAKVVETIPIEWCRPRGDTFEQMRENVWTDGLAQKGDTILIWVNEGDFLHACMTCGSKEHRALSDAKQPEGE